MDAQEKAQELITKFSETFTGRYSEEFDAKQCAIIAVDEILVAIDWHEFEYPNEEFEYWHAVKDEINKL